MEWEELQEEGHSILAHCKGASFCEARVEKTDTWSAVISQNRISKIYCVPSEGITISLYSGNRKTSFSLPGEKVADLKGVVSRFTHSMSDSLPPWMEETETDSCRLNLGAEIDPLEDTLAMAEWTLQELDSLQNDQCRTTAVVRGGSIKKAYLNNKEIESEFSCSFSEYNQYLQSDRGDFGYFNYVHRPPRGSYDTFRTVIASVRQVCEAFPSAKLVKPSRCPLVLDAVPFSVLVHEVFGHLLEYDLATMSCFTRDSLETHITSPLVTIGDIPSLEDTLYVPFDDEGTIGKEALPVKSGILREFLVDRKTAHEIAQVPKGNGRAEGYYYTPMIRSRITVFHPGEHHFEELLEEAEGGLYLYGVCLVDARPDGTFRLGVPLAYPIRKGELGTPFYGAVISGNIFDFMNQVGAIGKENQFQAGNCSKGVNGGIQSVKVGTVCPSASFKSWIVECDGG
ncbi:MAG: TldD/PmbA family protein [Theionarchaea archaeon]|nr:TldD/PmbA family protein [Theionarchaea archaeon]